LDESQFMMRSEGLSGQCLEGIEQMSAGMDEVLQGVCVRPECTTFKSRLLTAHTD
jgi:hypothetical protein